MLGRAYHYITTRSGKLNQLFEFVATSGNAFIKKFTIKDNIVTIYNGEPGHLPEQSAFRMLKELKQKSGKCAGQPYASLTNNDDAHRVINPHHNRFEGRSKHWHLSACEIITPTDVDALLKQILQLQGDEYRLAAFKDHYKPQLDALAAQGKTIEINMQPEEFMTPDDAKKLSSSYKAYYSENGGKINRQHKHHDYVLSAEGSVTEIICSATRSAVTAAAFELICQGLKRQNISSQKTQYIMDALALLFVAAYTKDIMPALQGIVVARVVNLLPESKHSGIVKAGIALGFCALNAEHVVSGHGAIKFTASLVSSILSAAGVRQALNYFFGEPPAAVQRPVMLVVGVREMRLQ